MQCYFLVFGKQVEIQHFQKTYENFAQNLNTTFELFGQLISNLCTSNRVDKLSLSRLCLLF